MNSTRTAVACIVAVALAASVASCGGGGDEVNCIDSMDCAFGQACRDAECVVVPCASAEGCVPKVEICAAPVLVLDGIVRSFCTAPCNVFHECPSGQVCRDKICQVSGGIDQDVLGDAGEDAVGDVIDAVGEDAPSPEDTIWQDGSDDPGTGDSGSQDTYDSISCGSDCGNYVDIDDPDTNIPEDLNGQDTNGQDTSGQDTSVVDNGALTDVSAPPICPANQDIANLLRQAEGTVDVMLCGAVVTKVTQKGWYIADDSSTRGMYIYEGSNPDWGYHVEVGDYVRMHVSSYSNYLGTQQVYGKENVTVHGKADYREYVVDLSTGTVPSESIESRIVRIEGVKVTAAAGKSGTIDYGTARNVSVLVEYNDIPCIGLQADIVAGIISQYNSVFQVVLTEDADLDNVSLANCETPPEYDMSNWDFEKQSVEEDPPEGFTKGPGNTFTCVRDVDGGTDGSAGIVLTWTSTDMQDLIQGYRFPTAAGSTVIFSVDVLDNDPAGRVRLGLLFYDADNNFITGSNSWSSDYSMNSPVWQSLSHQAVAPAGAAFAEGKLRMYDHQPPDGTWGNPNASAFVTIDNWEMTSVAP